MKYKITLRDITGGVIKAIAADVLDELPLQKIEAEDVTVSGALAKLAELIEDRERGKDQA